MSIHPNHLNFVKSICSFASRGRALLFGDEVLRGSIAEASGEQDTAAFDGGEAKDDTIECGCTATPKRCWLWSQRIATTLDSPIQRRPNRRECRVLWTDREV